MSEVRSREDENEPDATTRQASLCRPLPTFLTPRSLLEALLDINRVHRYPLPTQKIPLAPLPQSHLPHRERLTKLILPDLHHPPRLMLVLRHSPILLSDHHPAGEDRSLGGLIWVGELLSLGGTMRDPHVVGVDALGFRLP